MELFGIAFSIPVAFVASVGYSFIIQKAGQTLPRLRKPVLSCSVVILAALVLEWGQVKGPQVGLKSEVARAGVNARSGDERS